MTGRKVLVLATVLFLAVLADLGSLSVFMPAALAYACPACFGFERAGAGIQVEHSMSGARREALLSMFGQGDFQGSAVIKLISLSPTRQRSKIGPGNFRRECDLCIGQTRFRSISFGICAFGFAASGPPKVDLPHRIGANAEQIAGKGVAVTK